LKLFATRDIVMVPFDTIMITGADPGSILFGRTRQAVLALTFLRPDESFYFREIVRRTGSGTGPVQRELKLLTDSGILRRDRHRFYQANPASPIFEPLKQIVIRTIGLADRLKAALSPLADQIVIALIFGSFSRGEHHEQSDVDVLAVTRDDRLTPEQVDAALAAAATEIGREINPFVLTAEECRRKWKDGNPFLRRVLDGEKVYLIGGDDELKRLAEKRLAQVASAQPAGSARPSRAGRPRPLRRADRTASS
jgi:predicted nucleotidyltransferase